MASNNNQNRKSNGKRNFRGKQGRKDNGQKRINLDNERESKFDRDYGKNRCNDNDLSWYTRNPELFNSSSSIVFTSVTGRPLPFKRGVGSSVPGVMILDWMPSFGGVNTQALNTAKDSTFSFTIHKNNRQDTYDANDQMLVIIAGMQVFTMLASMIRAYGVAKNFSEVNNYTPYALLEGMGFDSQDFLDHLSSIWFDINALIAETQQIWIPNVFPLLSRWFWLNSNIYYDGESQKSQFYMFNQRYYYQYVETAFEDGGCLARLAIYEAGDTKSFFTPGAGTTYTWGQWKIAFHHLLDPLVASQDRGLIMGDLLKAFGSERIYALNEIPANYKVTPTYNKEVLSQIENASIIGASNELPLVLKQDMEHNTLVECYSDVNASSTEVLNLPPRHVVLNLHVAGQPSGGEVMIATRLQNAGYTSRRVVSMDPTQITAHSDEKTPWTTTSTGSTHLIPISTGSEVITGLYVSYRDYVNDAGLIAWKHITSARSFNWSATVPDVTIATWTAFDWAPWMYCVSNTAAPGVGFNVPEADWALGDYDNYVTIGGEELSRLHTTALYSLWGMPMNLD